MDKQLIGVFAMLIRGEIDVVLEAWQRIRDGVDGTKQFHHDEFWIWIEALTAGMVRITNYLEPVKPAYHQRGADLRTALGVSSPQLKDIREIRNRLQHFDEQVDSWWKNSTSHNFVDRLIGGAVDASGVAASDCARWYNTDDDTLNCFGHAADIGAAISAVEALQGIIPARYPRF